MKNINEKDLSQAAKKANIDLNALKNAAENGNVDDFINKNLSAQASSKLKEVLKDKDATQKLLSSPQAKELMQKFMKG